jgi:hypothetical protein
MTRQRPSALSYLIVGVLGLVVTVVAAIGWSASRDIGSGRIVPVLISASIGAVLYGASGFLSGSLWPGAGWRWGLLLIAPLFLILALSVAFAGFVGQFLRNDLPVLLVSFGAASMAAQIGGGITMRRRHATSRLTSQ